MSLRKTHVKGKGKWKKEIFLQAGKWEKTSYSNDISFGPWRTREQRHSDKVAGMEACGIKEVENIEEPAGAQGETPAEEKKLTPKH